ncbi:hypothetical protein [Paracoccus versutus]|nr:hypothetical protein [Paracoccus versutus]
MIEIRQTDTFREWLLSLRDARANRKIASRIQGRGSQTPEM